MSPETEEPDNYKIKIEESEIYEGQNIILLKLKYDHSELTFKIFKHIDFRFLIEIDSKSLTVRKTYAEEILLRLESNINNNVKVEGLELEQPEFYTDTNGLLMMKRIKDHRLGWKWKNDEPVSSNFYPVNYAISLQDTKTQIKGISKTITIFNDRSQSGGAMKAGELMLDFNRSTRSVDYRGLNESPCEEQSCNIPFKVKHWLAVSNNFNKVKMNGLIN